MEIRQLRYLVMASRTRNFSQAAARCFTSRQNLTSTIRELEAELGAEFFKIVSNKPVLTQDGELAYRKAEQILQQVDELEELFTSSATRAKQELSVLYPVYMRLANDNVYNAATGFDAFSLALDEQMPDVCYKKICQGQADLALVYALTREFPECESIFMGSSPIRILVGESCPLADKHRVMMADFANYDLLLLPNREFVYQRFVEVFRDCGLNERQIHTVVDYSLMIEQVRGGSSVAVCSKTFPGTLPPGIVSIPFEDIGCEWCLYLLFKKETEKQAQLAQFISYLERDPRIASLAVR